MFSRFREDGTAVSNLVEDFVILSSIRFLYLAPLLPRTNSIMTHYLLAVGRIAFFFFTCLHVSIAQDSPALWPKEITTDQGQIVVYQPQPSDLDGSKLTGTAAFSILPQGKNDPLFGALFFSAMLDFDRDNHLYTLRSCDVTNVRFASQDSTIDMEKVKAGIVSAIPTWNFTGSTDQLITTIERASLRESNAGFKNDPPAIIYRSKPAVLVLIDRKSVV